MEMGVGRLVGRDVGPGLARGVGFVIEIGGGDSSQELGSRVNGLQIQGKEG